MELGRRPRTRRDPKPRRDLQSGTKKKSVRAGAIGRKKRVRVSRNQTKGITANGNVQNKEKATVYVKDLALFVTVQLLKNTPLVLSLRRRRENHVYSYERTRG